ncbi:MAG TPA: GntR family transcriptional regulator [Solirubrobacteraceae bacterium]|nr:GntR family transcriptional regulator [Solirubrobacteraceae bacterium]
MTHPDVLIPERLTGTLVVPPLVGIGTSVAQLAYAAIRNAVLAMDAYDPNADLRLDEKRLASGLGVSRTPVREALARLAHEGLVEIIPRRGVRVVRKSKAEIVEMIIAWAALEAMAARLATERAPDRDLAGLRGLFSEFEGGELRSHLDEYSAANLRFHQRIIELGHSQLIADMADDLLVHVRAIRRHTIGEGDRVERSIVDHLHIIEALEARETDLAERLVRDHALNLARHVERSWVID